MSELTPVAELIPQEEPEHETVWQAIPGSSQEFAIDSRCDHTLYHGARGPGKTITQLMRYRRFVGRGYGEFWRGVIFDREFKNLSDVVAQSRRFFMSFGDGARFLSGASDYKWVWPTGEELLFRHVKKLSDYDNFHGHEYPFLGWNELTKYPTSELYDRMMSTNRSSFVPKLHTPRKQGAIGEYDTEDGKPLPEIPLFVFSTTNPNGPGHNWVKRKFIIPGKGGKIVKTEVPIFNPRTQEDEVITKTQVAIFGSYRENPYLPPQYVAELNLIKDPNLKAAWLKGSWDVNAGGMFDDIWRGDIHVIPRFCVPYNWRVDRAFDWGSTHPFCAGWWAEANGEQVIFPDGVRFTPVRGSLILCHEWYGTQQIGTNKGIKMSAKNIARGIKKMEVELLAQKWLKTVPQPGPADTQISNVRESDVDTIEKKMADEGVRWTKADKSQGSRINGCQLLRDMLEASIIKEGKAIYFMNHCVATIEIIPSLPRDTDNPDDVDTDAEDHPYDMTRYRVAKGANRLATKINVIYPT